MNTLALKKESKNESVNENDQSLELLLRITEQTVLKYLYSFDELIREEKALEALRVGVIAIQSASPSLDTKVVDEKFNEVKSTIDGFLTNFQGDLKTKLEDYFKSGSGTVPRSLDIFFGDNGTLSSMLNKYFNSDGGKLQQLIQDQIGPSSTFVKSLDPSNKESYLSKLEEFIKNHLQEKTDNIIREFSLDTNDSALSRLQQTLLNKVGEIQQANTNFFVELKQALGIQEGKQLESEKGTEKGREFETALYDYVAEIGRNLGDRTENVRAIVGKVARSKVGDYVLTLGSTSGAPNLNIVVEVKKEQRYKLKDAIVELKVAKENREAEAGIFVFAKGYEPPEVGDFYNLGNDFYITVDDELLINGEPLLFFETAYKIIRAMLVTSKRIEKTIEIDIDRIKRELESIIELVSRISDIKTKAKTISSNSKFIEDTADSLKLELETRLNGIITQQLK